MQSNSQSQQMLPSLKEPPSMTFICPKEKNHKCEGRERFIRHLWNCKGLKCYPEFYSCKYESMHVFITSEEKILHEQECPLQAKYKGPNATMDESSLVPNMKVRNPGNDLSFV